MSDSPELLDPRRPIRELGEFLRDLLSGRQEGREGTVHAEVREARLSEDPILTIEHRFDHPEVLVHVFAELPPAHLEDVPWTPGPSLHLLEHPSLVVVMEDGRDLGDDVPPHPFLEDLVSPMFERRG